MGFQIDDGTGKGGPAKVAGNRLYTFSLTESPMEKFGSEGDAFWLATDFISITTTASFTGVFYLKNTHGTKQLHIAFWRQSSSVGTQWRVIKNPTGGTLLSSGTDIIPENSNFASGKVASAVFKKGADAQTITGGSLIGQHMTGVYQALNLPIDGAMTLVTGNSIAIECKPSAAGLIGITMTIWYEDTEG